MEHIYLVLFPILYIVCFAGIVAMFESYEEYGWRIVMLVSFYALWTVVTVYYLMGG